MGEVAYKGEPISVKTDDQVTIVLPPLVYGARLTGFLFDTDKTFLLPGAIPTTRELKEFYDEHPDVQVLVVGHADARGAAAHNLALSEERARAVAAFLTDDADAWLAFYRSGHTGKAWGLLEDQHMLAALGGFDGVAGGRATRAWTAAVKAFQQKNGLAETGDSGGDTRKKLVAAYMAQDGTTLPKGTKVVVHGCGSFHPEDPGRGEEADRRNRRVEVFLSQGPIAPAPGPCAAPSGCTQQPAWVKKSIDIRDLRVAPDDDIELALEWSADLVDRLPDDLEVRLSGDGLPEQVKRMGDVDRDGDVARLTFAWTNERCATRLEAVAGGKTVILWSDRMVGDLDVDRMLGELCRGDGDDELAGEPTFAGERPQDELSGQGDG